MGNDQLWAIKAGSFCIFGEFSSYFEYLIFTKMFSISNTNSEEDSLLCVLKQVYIKLKVATFIGKDS